MVGACVDSDTGNRSRLEIAEATAPMCTRTPVARDGSMGGNNGRRSGTDNSQLHDSPQRQAAADGLQHPSVSLPTIPGSSQPPSVRVRQAVWLTTPVTTLSASELAEIQLRSDCQAFMPMILR